MWLSYLVPTRSVPTYSVPKQSNYSQTISLILINPIFTIDCEKIAVEIDKTLRLNVLALNVLVLNSCSQNVLFYINLTSLDKLIH